MFNAMHKTKVAMKRLFPIGAILTLLLAVGCSKSDDYFDEPKPDEEPTEQFDVLCEQINRNMASLQALIGVMQEGDYIDEVSPVMQGGKEIGHTITFEDSDPITIYYSTENDTEANGAMPVISVRQDEDEVYYWTLNGAWLLEKGNKVQVQSALPQLKLQNGEWYLSNDGEQTWQKYGKATEADYDRTFQSVTEKEDNVDIILSNGSKITLPRITALTVQIMEQDTLLQFLDDETKTICYTITGGGKNQVVKVEMQNDDGGYTLHTTSESATAGTVDIQANTPTENRVIVSVSNSRQTVQASIAVAGYPPFDGLTIRVETPGTLSQLLSEHDQSILTELRVIGSIDDEDIATLKALAKRLLLTNFLLILDIENTDITSLPEEAFFACKKLTAIKLPKTLTTIGDRAFHSCSDLTSITIPNSVTTIGEWAFELCTNLTSITIPNSVTTIREWTFAFCSNLTSITIPNSVTTIGDYTFAKCTSLTSITIPNSVTTIGSQALAGCDRLTRIDCQPNTPPQLGSEVFQLTPVENCVLYVPTGCAEAYRTAEGWKSYTFQEIIETNF